jgi:hypothetical protein
MTPAPAMSSHPPTTVTDWAYGLLFGDTLDQKLLPPGPLPDRPGPKLHLPAAPGRPSAWAFTDEREPFPSRAELAQPQARGRMLHSFANHELLAIELFALALLRMPQAPPAFRNGLVRIITE